MYSLDCSYYDKEFASIDELVRDVVESGMDPNYRITYNGKRLAETVWHLIGPEA